MYFQRLKSEKNELRKIRKNYSAKTVKLLQKNWNSLEENLSDEDNPNKKKEDKDLPKPDKDGWLPIHYAIRKGDSLENVRVIIEKYSDCLKIPNGDGDFPLHLAAYWGRSALVPFLIEKYPEAKNIKTPAGNTPYELASSSSFSNQETIDLLATATKDEEKATNSFSMRTSTN